MPIWPFFGENFENWYPAFPLKPAFLGCFLSEKVFLKRQILLIMSSDRPKRQTVRKWSDSLMGDESPVATRPPGWVHISGPNPRHSRQCSVQAKQHMMDQQLAHRRSHPQNKAVTRDDLLEWSRIAINRTSVGDRFRPKPLGTPGVHHHLHGSEGAATT